MLRLTLIGRTALLLAYIFQAHLFDLSLHEALKHTVISCSFFDRALKGSWLLSICTTSCLLSECPRLKHAFCFATVLVWQNFLHKLCCFIREICFKTDDKSARQIFFMFAYVNAHIFTYYVSTF